MRFKIDPGDENQLNKVREIKFEQSHLKSGSPNRKFMAYKMHSKNQNSF